MTNILWLGEISEYWSKKRIKDVTEINISNKSKKDDEEITFLPMNLVNSDGSYNINNKKKTKEYSSGFTYFEKNDVILAKITPCFENKKSAVLDLIETEKGYGSTEFHVFRTNKHFFNKFMLYLFKTDAFIDFGVSNFKGSAGHKRVPFEVINSMEVPTPNIKEQELIANYLDKKTTSIDNSIETLKSQKERLMEQKKAIIHKAVTKGLDDSVEMKDSGVEWIGEIPKHWEVKKWKNILKILNGYSFKSDDHDETSDALPIVKMSNLKDGNLFLDNAQKVKYKKDYKSYILKEGDLLLGMSGSIENFAFVKKEDGVCALNQRVCSIKSFKTTNKYIKYFIQSSSYKQKIKLNALGTAILNLSTEDLKNMEIAISEMKEQQEIVKYLDKKTSLIEKAVNEVEKQISLLEEYKKTLINDVVTGKIKVF